MKDVIPLVIVPKGSTPQEHLSANLHNLAVFIINRKD